MQDQNYMRMALEQARLAYDLGEIPVGAVLVCGDEVVARDHNRKETNQDATAHAELLVLQQAAKQCGEWRLSNATLYCTLEPCPMCAGAMINARIKRLVYAAKDGKAGAAGSMLDVLRYPGLNHQVEVLTGVLEAESVLLLQDFFMSLRRDGRAGRRRSTRNRVGG